MYSPVNASFTLLKWGLTGSKLYRYVFVMSSWRLRRMCYVNASSQPCFQMKHPCARGAAVCHQEPHVLDKYNLPYLPKILEPTNIHEQYRPSSCLPFCHNTIPVTTTAYVPRILPLKSICCCKESLISRICKKSLALFLFFLWNGCFGYLLKSSQ